MTREVQVSRSALAQLVGPQIELETNDGLVDLHNFADFIRLQFSHDGTLILVWREAERGMFRIGRDPISELWIVFDEVRSLEVGERDPAVPVSEDRALQDFEMETSKADLLQVRFTFVGGRIVRICARGLRILIPEGTGGASTAIDETRS